MEGELLRPLVRPLDDVPRFDEEVERPVEKGDGLLGRALEEEPDERPEPLRDPELWLEELRPEDEELRPDLEPEYELRPEEEELRPDLEPEDELRPDDDELRPDDEELRPDEERPLELFEDLLFPLFCFATGLAFRFVRLPASASGGTAQTAPSRSAEKTTRRRRRFM